MSLIEKFVSGFIERSCKHYVTTIIGLLGLAIYAFNYFGCLIPLQYHDAANMVATVIQGIALILAKDSNAKTVIPVPNKLLALMIVLGLSLAFAVPTSAQDAPAAPSNGFVADSAAVAYHFNGSWSAATHLTESYDFYDFGKTKSNRLYLTGHQFLAPTPGINIYAGGFKFSPDLNAALSKFNVPANTLNVELGAAFGNGISSGGSHFSFIIDGRLKYRATSSLSWNALEVGYVRYGNQNGVAISSGLSYIFGPK